MLGGRFCEDEKKMVNNTNINSNITSQLFQTS
jgi:hypothetical protein